MICALELLNCKISSSSGPNIICVSHEDGQKFGIAMHPLGSLMSLSFCSFVLKASNLSHLDVAAAQQMQQQQQQQPQMDTSGHSQVPTGGVAQVPTSAVTSQTSYLASCSHSASYLTDEASLSNRERSVVSKGLTGFASIYSCCSVFYQLLCKQMPCNL